MTVGLRLLVLCCALAMALPVRAQVEFRRATAPRAWEFPRDHGSHPEYSTEWWYFTGSLFDSNDHRYGFELTFFRVGLRPDLPEVPNRSAWRTRDMMVAHFTVTEVDWKRFHQGERMQRAMANVAGARPESLDVWIDDWSARLRDGRIHLQAHHEGLAVDLWLTPSRDPVLHGSGGLSWKNAARTEASHYVSQTRMQTSGSLTVGGMPRAVSGSTWMDHEFFSGPTPRDGVGWDWFSARLSDGRDLMIYRVRREGEAPTVFGTEVGATGEVRALETKGAEFRATRWWTSPRTGGRYPVEWEVELPAEALLLRSRPTLDEQEVVARRTVGFSYWEGLCDHEVVWNERSLSGEGYVELTGYPKAEGRLP